MPELALLARLMPDGLIHYDVNVADDPKLEPLHFIRVSGDHDIPAQPGGVSTTPQEHDRWLEQMRNQGYVVEDHVAAPGQEMQTVLSATRRRPGSRTVGMPELRQLPLLACLALAARTARRVQNLFRTFPDSVDKEQMHRTVEFAIKEAEKVAAGEVGQTKFEEVNHIAEQARYVARRLLPPPADSIARLVADVATAAAAALRPKGDGEEVIRHAVTAIRNAANTVAFTKAIKGDTLTGAAEFDKMITDRFDDLGDEGIHNAVARDYATLFALNLGRFPDLGRSVDPTPAGPLGVL